MNCIDEAVKNHRLEKRQDDSYLFFGGWRPVKSGNQVYHAAASGRYHDLISALPGSFDSAANLYAHALPSASNYYKDIFSYYPRPAIKATPKKNTPVYVERLKPKRQQSKHGGRNGGSQGSPQIIDIQKLELKHLRDLQNILLQAKELPLTQLNLPNSGGKPYEVVELSLQHVQQNNRNTGSRNSYRYNRNRGAQGNNKGSYRRPQNISPGRSPFQFQYISLPKIKPLVPQIHPKQIAVQPLNIPSVSGIEDILSLKNIQVLEVPVPGTLPVSYSTGKGNGGSQYGKRNNAHGQQQYRISSPKTQQKFSFPSNTYYAHQAEQPRKHYPAPTPSQSSYGSQQKQPQIEAELFKLSEEEVQQLLKNLQIVKQNSQDFLKILPFAEAAHKSKGEQVQLILALPPEEQQKIVDTSAYETQNQGEDGSYGAKQQYVAVPQQVSYPSHGGSVSYNSGGYQVSNEGQAAEHNAAGYQIDEQAAGNPYEQYQSLDEKSGYSQQSYEQAAQSQYDKGEEQAYAQSGYDAPTQQQGAQTHREQYLEVMSPPSDASGYRREPVLAVEIQKGQTIEDAIKSIDRETLQRLGAHGKDGLEIEVVEVPVDEYSSESKKTETYVSSSNSTTKAQTKRTTTAIPSVKEKSTTTEKKS